MLPFRDHNPSGTVPYVTLALIVVNLAVFVVEMRQGERIDEFVEQYGLKPARVFGWREPPRRSRWPFILPSGPVAYKVPVWATFFTSMFLHGGWLHLLGNMWYLWLFGDNVEDRMGHLKFLIFYLVCGLAAALAQLGAMAATRVSLMQGGGVMIGASGAIAGVLGAYIVAFPKARISTLMFIWFYYGVVDLPAYVVLGFWFVLQLFSGASALMVAHTGGVAWWAHIGGFVAGMLLLGLFQKPPEKRRVYAYRPRTYGVRRFR